MSEFDAELLRRFTRYVMVDSQSDEISEALPSTDVQWDMLRLLVDELREIGAQDVRLTEYGAVLATIPGSVSGPVVGLLAHVDTAPQFNASGVRPRVIEKWDGAPIRFPNAPDLCLSPSDFPYLAQKKGHDIVTASGDTLLGADDKAGVAIIMTAARYLLASALEFPTLRIAFTTDEEIGRGIHPNLPADLGADFAYTFDGAEVGEIEYESFSADSAVITVTGVSIHPGEAKDKLVNALHLAAKIVEALPQKTMSPEVTSGREGFIHIYELVGSAAQADLRLILRDFELGGLDEKTQMLQRICEDAQQTEPRAQIILKTRPQYRNMRYWLEKDMTPVDIAHTACRNVGIEPRSAPIRGGTDGSRLTEMGVPCPNLFTGMQNVHGPLEWVSVQDMAVAVRLCIALVQEAGLRFSSGLR